MIGNSYLNLFCRELNLAEESVCDTDKSISWPVEEIIDRCGADQCWELTGTESEHVTNGREAETHVEIPPYFVDEEGLQSISSVLYSL